MTSGTEDRRVLRSMDPHGTSVANPAPDPRIVEACARVANEVYREVYVGDDVFPTWTAADDRHRAIARDTVAAVLAGSTPQNWHERWRADRLSEGWRPGPVKDDDAKTHPYLVEYNDLPDLQRMLDSLFVVVVRATRAAIADLDRAASSPDRPDGSDVVCESERTS